MLQSLLIQQLILQLLEPVPQLTPVLPLSVSLISVRLGKPLLSCISKAALDQDNSIRASSGDLKDIHAVHHGHDTYFVNEATPLLHQKESSKGAESINRSKSPMYLADAGRSSSGGYSGEPADDPSSAMTKIDELQREIDNLEENYDSDYIDANVNPVDNLNILFLLVMKDWTQRQEKENWKVYSFNKYRLYMHYVNEEYTLLFCTTEEFPSAIAISKLEAVSKILSAKL